MATNYRAAGMTLIASGAVTHENIVALAQERFAALKPGPGPVAQPAHYRGGDYRADQDLEQAHVTLAFPGVSSADCDIWAEQVYATVLGGGMSSRLFQEAREKRGLCYSIYAFAHSFADAGMIGIYAGTGEAQAAALVPVICAEMAAVAQGATDNEVARAKAQLKSGVLMGLERPSARAEQIAAQLFTFGRVLPLGELIAKLDAVDAATVRRFGGRIMEAGAPALAALGPIGKLESYETLANRFGASSALPAS
jgi:predicted Zn-dependent peptidase